MPEWIFNDEDKGYPAAASSQSLEGDNLDTENIFVREAIQNAYEAHDKEFDDPVKIKISKFSLDGKEKEKFVSNFELDVIKDKSEKFDEEKFPGYFDKGKKILKNLSNLNEPIKILSIEDYNTIGLKGHWRGPVKDSDKNFYSLVFGFYRSDKSDGNNLGSYGAGSQFFAKSSDLKTAIYYTVIKEKNSPETDVYSRAIGKGLFPEFPLEDKEGPVYDNNGFGYFGKPKEATSKVDASPLNNEDAFNWIETMGLPTRSKNEVGTSIFIIGCDFSIVDIENAIARNWWPLWYREEKPPLITLQDEKGNQSEFNIFDKKFSYLQSFMDCYKIADGLDNQDFKKEKIICNNREAGIVSYTKNTKKTNENFKNKIAYIFNNFVIEYKDLNVLDEQFNFTALFNANTKNAELEEMYRLAQPETHDKIEANQRVKQKFPWAEKFIKSTHKEITKKIKKFITQDMPQSENFTYSTTENPLNNFLKGIINIKGKRSGPGGGGDKIEQPLRSISMQYSNNKRIKDKQEVEVLLKLSSNAVSDKMNVKFLAECPAIFNSRGLVDKQMSADIEITNTLTNEMSKGKKGELQLTLDKSSTVKIFCSAKIVEYLNFEWNFKATKISEDNNVSSD